MKKAFLDVVNNPVKCINILDTVFNKIKPQTLHKPFFRGVFSKHDLKNYKKGSIITFDDFLSTSLSPSASISYQKCGKTACCILVFHISNKLPFYPLQSWMKGSKPILQYNKQVVSPDVDHEILLPRNTSWKIIKKYKTAFNANQAVSCSYANIEKTQKEQVTVYELVFMPYATPAPLKALDENSFHYIHDEKRDIYIVKDYFALHNKHKLIV